MGLALSGVARAEPKAGVVVLSGRTSPQTVRAVQAELGLYPSLDLHIGTGALRDEVLGCAGDAECLSQAFLQREAVVGVVLAVMADDAGVRVVLQVVDAAARRSLVKRFTEIDTNTVRRDAAVARALRAALVEAGYEAGGRLRLRLAPPDATVWVDGVLVDLAAGDPVLPSGTRAVRAEHPDHEPLSATVQVPSGGSADLVLTLRERTSVWRSPWLWVGVGVVVAGAAAAAVAVATRPDPVTELCLVPSGGACR